MEILEGIVSWEEGGDDLRSRSVQRWLRGRPWGEPHGLALPDNLLIPAPTTTIQQSTLWNELEPMKIFGESRPYDFPNFLDKI